MDLKYLETETDLKNDLINFTKKNMPTSKAELELGTKFEYTDKFIEFIVIKGFEKSNKVEEFPTVMQNLIGERKHQLIMNSSKSSDIMIEGRFAEYPFVIDYDEKRGTLLKYNNRTLSKHVEIESVNNNVKSIVGKLRKEPLKNTSQHSYIGMSGNAAIVKAAEIGDLDFIKYNFEQGGLTFHVFNNDMIDRSAKSGHLEVVQYLVERGARVQRAIKYGTEDVKEWATKWKKEHPGKQRNFDIMWEDYKSMKENNPEWIKDISYEKVAQIQNSSLYEKDNVDEKKEHLLYQIALIRNVAGEEGVENFKNKVTKSMPKNKM